MNVAECAIEPIWKQLAKDGLQSDEGEVVNSLPELLTNSKGHDSREVLAATRALEKRTL